MPRLLPRPAPRKAEVATGLSGDIGAVVLQAVVVVEPVPAGETTGLRVVLTLGCLVGALGTWLVWFAWDTVRDVQPGTDDTTGPYELWQGVGAAATLLVLVVLAVRRLPLVDVVLAVSVGFTAGFTYSGATDPEADGLYVVGAALLLVVMLLATALVAFLARRVLRRRAAAQHPDRGPDQPPVDRRR